jgi:hypothetical protein
MILVNSEPGIKHFYTRTRAHSEFLVNIVSWLRVAENVGKPDTPSVSHRMSEKDDRTLDPIILYIKTRHQCFFPRKFRSKCDCSTSSLCKELQLIGNCAWNEVNYPVL